MCIVYGTGIEPEFKVEMPETDADGGGSFAEPAQAAASQLNAILRIFVTGRLTAPRHHRQHCASIDHTGDRT